MMKKDLVNIKRIGFLRAGYEEKRENRKIEKMAEKNS